MYEILLPIQGGGGGDSQWQITTHQLFEVYWEVQHFGKYEFSIFNKISSGLNKLKFLKK